ncbi:MAG TPA: DUF3500 domain-containing protein [Vicinamibacterales bacterium]
MTSIFRASTILLVLLALAVSHGSGQRASQTPPASPADATARIAAAATALVSALDEAGRGRVQFPFEGPQKTKWSNLPTGIFERQGLRMGDLTPAQRAAVMKLLQSALSPDGYRKVTEIIRADEVLRGGGSGRGKLNFGEDEYYLAFLGTPSAKTPWMLQFGGHHLAINLTLAGGRASMTPSLPATQPAKYTFEGREIRPLGKENDKAFELINALDEAQRGQAILKFSVSDLVLGPGQDGRVIQPEGIRASVLSAAQQTLLLEIVREWAGIMNESFAEPRMAEIRANLPQTYFAWSGPTTNGSVAYFRIQGPTLVIEYAPQKSVDHIHTIYRDPTNDYGAKFAAK